jgi:hypothetical protein
MNPAAAAAQILQLPRLSRVFPSRGAMLEAWRGKGASVHVVSFLTLLGFPQHERQVVLEQLDRGDMRSTKSLNSDDNIFSSVNRNTADAEIC